MKVIGFAFNKLQSSKFDSYKNKSNKTTNIEITNIEKDNLPFEAKSDSYKVSFKFQVDYLDAESKKETKVGEVIIEGFLNVLLEDDEAKDLIKSWKKKELADEVKQPLFNLILRKCSTKSLELEDDVNLPSHIPIPQIRISSKN